MSDIERVEKIREFLKLNKKVFSEILGYSHPQSYTKYLSGSNSLSFNALTSLKEYNNDIDINWVLTGQGSMLLSENGNSAETEVLKKEIEYLKKSLADKEKIISMLENNKS